jgi:PPOX class probable F420-dependent enzyme
MIGSDLQDAFISAHLWAVLTTLRKDGTPSSSMIAYARQGDELVVSTPGTTLKRRTVSGDPRVALAIVGADAPFDCLTLEGRAVVETSDLAAATRAVLLRVEDLYGPAPQGEALAQWMAASERVILRITPTRVYATIRRWRPGSGPQGEWEPGYRQRT